MKLNKHIIYPLLLALSATIPTACSDDDNELSYPAKLEVVTTSGTAFDGRGGKLQLLVNTNMDYEVSTDVDWIAQEDASRSARPLNDRVTFTVAPYEKATNQEPRTGSITFTADGVDPVTVTVEQVAGELYRFRIAKVSTNDVPAKGGEIEITVESNIEYTVSTSDDSWISQTQAKDNKHVFTIAENTATSPREGTITFVTAGLGDFKVEFQQDPYIEKNGIYTATQLVEFATAVNSGASLQQWMDESEEIALMADLDMTGVNWTPIGNVTGSTIANGAATLGTGNPFKGVFNGNGHTIRNLAMSTDAAQIFGLFGVCSGATVKDLTIDQSCTLQVMNEELKAGSVYGFIAGLAISSTFEDITVNGHVLESLLYKGSTKYFGCLGGVVGHVTSCTIKNCTYGGTFDRVRSNIYDNSIGSSVGGIVAFARGSASAPTQIENCVNSGYVSGHVHRVGGILAGTTGNYIMRNCANRGVVHASVSETAAGSWANGLRVGGLIGINTNTSANNVATVEDCTNAGTVVCEGDKNTQVGALLGNPRRHTLTNAVNTGTLITTGDCIAGLIIGQLQCADSPTIVSAKCGGNIANAFTGTGINITAVNPVAMTAANYFEYTTGAITGTNSGVWTAEKVTFLAQ